jgi:hypothetical protein
MRSISLIGLPDALAGGAAWRLDCAGGACLEEDEDDEEEEDMRYLSPPVPPRTKSLDESPPASKEATKSSKILAA